MTALDLHRITSGFYEAFATGVAWQQGQHTLPDTWLRPPFWDLLMLQYLRPELQNLPYLYSTCHLEYPSVLYRFCSCVSLCHFYLRWISCLIHLYWLRWAAGNAKQAKISKWKFLPIVDLSLQPTDYEALSIPHDHHDVLKMILFKSTLFYLYWTQNMYFYNKIEHASDQKVCIVMYFSCVAGIHGGCG